MITPVNPEWLDNGKNSPIYGKLKTQFSENMAGKGSLVNKELEKMESTKIMHQYQVLWKIGKNSEYKKVHFIGDSHGVYGGVPFGQKSNKQIGKFLIKSHPMGPVLMYNFGKKKLNYINIKNLNKFMRTDNPISNNDMVIFSLGEIDIRCHIKKHDNGKET